MNNSRKILSVILAVIAAVCLIAAVTITVRRLTDYMHLQNTVEALRPSDDAAKQEEASSEPDPLPSRETVSGNEAEPSESAEEPADIQEPLPDPVVNPYRESFLANSDMAAWLQIPGTVIDYPVMWTPDNEEYYLRRGFDGLRDSNGCLILDTDSCVDPLTTNLIIHGHNMKAGTMFGTLTDYESEEFFEGHRSMILYTEECQRNYEVIAVFRSQVYKKSQQVFKFYKFFQADTQEEFDDFYNNIKDLALYDTGVTAEFGDRFLTLSTCSTHVEQGRFVVVAKEVESGDTYLPIQE
ncbi:MAG: class B sortase [bacterium]|nr:class B sortase [bacterium]